MKERTNRVNGLLMLIVYGIFALFSLLLVVVGAKVYRNVVSTGRENTQTRAAFSYVANKIRMSTRFSGTLRLEEEDGMEVLVLETLTEGYETRIFYHDGALRELYQSADMELIPEMGEKIVEVRDFRIEVTREGNLILHSVDSEGKERSLHLYIEGKTL